ncbi:MAG: hypothetical protein GTO53_07355 [Planctomycetales bacterium]|nr:hypothetical protein [Planctomycetales bacterium]NIM08952.1 hypothetical protein [Planctomycetales bacterium]NIP69570.1 hypothetical protein [Planctomycetales bacterium]
MAAIGPLRPPTRTAPCKAEWPIQKLPLVILGGHAARLVKKILQGEFDFLKKGVDARLQILMIRNHRESVISY